MTEAKADAKIIFAKHDFSKYHKLVAWIYEVIDYEITTSTIYSITLDNKGNSVRVVFRDGYVLNLYCDNKYELLYGDDTVARNDRIHVILRSYFVSNRGDMLKWMSDIHAALPGTSNRLLYEQLVSKNKTDAPKAPTVDIDDKPPPYAPGG